MKTNTLLIGAVALTASALLSSCDDAGTIGESLLPIENTIIVEDDFTVTGHSVSNERIQSRTITQLLGKIDAEGYGNFSSDFVTQFMPAASLDTTLTSASAIDSLKLVMMYYNDGIVGDSIVPMGLEVYRLNKNLQAPIYSDFNPEDYYDASAPISSSTTPSRSLNISRSTLTCLAALPSNFTMSTKTIRLLTSTRHNLANISMAFMSRTLMEQVV
jgi:hypothetical protein